MSNITWITCKTLLSHYRYKKSQTVFLLLGLILGVALWSAVEIINGHAKASYAEANQLLGAQANDWIYSNLDSVPLDDYIKLRRSGWRQVYPVIEKRLSTKDGMPLTLIATDLMALPKTDDTQPNALDFSLWQSLFQAPYAVMVPENIAKKLSITEGSSIKLSSGRALPPAIIGHYTQQGQRLFMDIGAAAIVLDQANPSYLVVSSLSQDERQALDAWLKRNTPSLYRIENQQPLDLTQLTQSLHTHLSAMSLLAFAVGLFIVFNAVRFSLHTRRHTFAILRELGVDDIYIFIAIFIEASLLSLIASILGLLMGYGLSQLLLPSIASTLQNLYGAVLSQSIILSWHTLLGAWLLTLLGLALALVAPLIQQAKQTRKNALNIQSNWSFEATQQKRLTIYALIVLSIAAISYQWLDSLLHGFVLLAVLLFCGAAILPFIIQFTLSQLRRASIKQANSFSKWQWSEGITQMIPMRTAFMAMLLALTANFGVDSLVSSFKSALDQWLQQRIAADVYIQNNSPKIEQAIAILPWVQDTHIRNGLSLRWPEHQTRPTLIRGLDPRAPDVTSLPMAETLYVSHENKAAQWPTLYEHPSILANEQVKYLAGIELGDTIFLNTLDGEQKAFTVAGFYYDYGNPYYQFYLPFNTVKNIWPQAKPKGIALWLNRKAKNNEIDWEKDILELGLKPGDWIDRRSILNVSMTIFDRTFSMTAAINSLTFLVAGIALLLSLLAQHEKQLASYAHWRSMGLTWFEWVTLTGKPIFIALTMTWLLSIPLGSLLALLLIHDINVLSFGWTMDLKWQWQSALKLGVLCIIVSMAAFFIAALQVKYKLPTALKKLGQDQ
ncbi:ABC transporter permease [Bermanella marisrubri]|uniref:ABC3 transporter permease C-terminal domain-containing protein n=1 Tax=Bermanella marisrubri TaxID=207949 RepID=Q1N064_9GAMM|nr:ABC transporter permease [Bermanella marisrubri]EAT11653.1 hypothetical protein RED65_08189 [Oceanobacter sp. RED65] [Bermanella marisrubri]QIZ83307.1 ABC transporter permease [Bermanella marisrubri]